MKVKESDGLQWAGLCTNGCSVLLASSDGLVHHFRIDDTSLKPASRGTVGIRVSHMGESIAWRGSNVLWVSGAVRQSGCVV